MIRIKHPTIYARSNTGSVIEWWIEQIDNTYRIFSGAKGGQITATDQKEIKGKNLGKANETSDINQTDLEISALYKKKIKTKYKYSESDVDNSLYFKPMLAKKYSDYKEKINLSSGNFIAQIKYNGVRAIVSKNGIFSRTGERVVSVNHIFDSIKEIFEENPDLVLDGELFNHDLRKNLNELVSIVRKSVDINQEDVEKSKKIVRFYLYDVFIEETPYSKRKDLADRIVNQYSEYLRLVESFKITSNESLNELFNEAIENGQEGLMIRDLNSYYENKRSKNLLKVKVDDDDTCEIISVNEGDGDWKNKCKTFTVKWNEETFDATLKADMKTAENILKNKQEFVGEFVTFLYMGLTGKGIPNYARIDWNNRIPSTK